MPGMETALPSDTCKLEGDVEKFNKVNSRKVDRTIIVHL